MEEKKHSLREKKFARTKIALMQEFVKRLAATRFEAISIREVCEAVEVSEGTFFNYFPQKIDVLYYFTQMHTLKVVWETYRRTKTGSYIALIETAFQALFEDFNNPNIVYEIIASLVGQKQDPVRMSISVLEKMYAFPGCKGIEKIAEPSVMFEDFFKECLQKAIQYKELPAGADIDAIVVSLKTILCGTPLALKIKNFPHTKQHFQRQLEILWKGIKGK
jgi:AcrR family transcriptional regulator